MGDSDRHKHLIAKWAHVGKYLSNIVNSKELNFDKTLPQITLSILFENCAIVGTGITTHIFTLTTVFGNKKPDKNGIVVGITNNIKHKK